MAKVLISEFPWVGRHNGHVAFYSRNPAPRASEDVRFPDGTTPAYGVKQVCGTCGADIELLRGIIVTLRDRT